MANNGGISKEFSMILGDLIVAWINVSQEPVGYRILVVGLDGRGGEGF